MVWPGPRTTPPMLDDARGSSPLEAAASALARCLLGVNGNRWLHTRAVARRAGELAHTVSPEEREILVSAAWLHDIGYASKLRDTGLHSLDGARYLVTAGTWNSRLCALVAHHSAARFEAVERGLAEELALFPCEDSAVMDALVTADM